MLFGNEFDADERAEVGGGLRDGEFDDDFGRGDGTLDQLSRREDDGHDRVRTLGAIDSPHQVSDTISSH